MQPWSNPLLRVASMSILAFVFPLTASAHAPGGALAAQTQSSIAGGVSRTTAQPGRAQLSRAFSSKWSMYVQRVYGVPADVWVRRMAPNLANADASNLRNAMQRDTFEGAMAELGGTGARLSDEQVINFLAGGTKSNPTPQALGALSGDLVYTPIAPCRIVDTRNTGSGAIGSNSSRSFKALNSSDFTGQGGSATNCGTLGLSVTAVAVNLTAVSPVSAGYATAYPYGTPQPVSASINFVSGAVVNNGLIIQVPNPLATQDFTLYTLAQSHYVADIVGYFAPPLATALQCVETSVNQILVASNATGDVTAPVCPAGYTQTATNCRASDYLLPFAYIYNGVCSAKNSGVFSQYITASRTCCRVPGR